MPTNIPSAADSAYEVQSTDLIPLSNAAGSADKAVTPNQFAKAISDTKTFTVGANGDFANAGLCLDHIATLPQFTVTKTITGATATNGSSKIASPDAVSVADAGMTKFASIDGTGVADNDRVWYPVVGCDSTAKDVMLACPYQGTTGPDELRLANPIIYGMRFIETTNDQSIFSITNVYPCINVVISAESKVYIEDGNTLPIFYNIVSGVVEVDGTNIESRAQGYVFSSSVTEAAIDFKIKNFDHMTYSVSGDGFFGKCARAVVLNCRSVSGNHTDSGMDQVQGDLIIKGSEFYNRHIDLQPDCINYMLLRPSTGKTRSTETNYKCEVAQNNLSAQMFCSAGNGGTLIYDNCTFDFVANAELSRGGTKDSIELFALSSGALNLIFRNCSFGIDPEAEAMILTKTLFNITAGATLNITLENTDLPQAGDGSWVRGAGAGTLNIQRAKTIDYLDSFSTYTALPSDASAGMIKPLIVDSTVITNSNVLPLASECKGLTQTYGSTTNGMVVNTQGGEFVNGQYGQITFNVPYSMSMFYSDGVGWHLISGAVLHPNHYNLTTSVITTGNVPINCNNGRSVRNSATLTGSITYQNPTNAYVGAELLITVNNCGGFAIAFGTYFKVRSNPTGTSGQGATYHFSYIGANTWEQVGTVTWG